MIGNYFVVLVLIVTIHVCEYDCVPGEKKLLKRFFDPAVRNEYDIWDRPVKSSNETLEVNMKVYLINIIKLDIEKSQMHHSLWLTLSWKDYNFQWNPKDYGGEKSLHIPANKIWKPDIRLYNSVDDNMMKQLPIDVIINNEGNVIWVPPGQYKSSCNFDLSYFPFDKQRCKLKLGSWTYSSNAINVTSNCLGDVCSNTFTMNLDEYTPNNEFEIISTSGKRFDKMYPCCPESYTSYEYTIVFARSSLSYYVINFIIPCLIMSMMTLIMFTLPPATSGKIVFGTIILISLIGFQLIVAYKLPVSFKNLPLICQYILCIMILCFLSILCSAIALSLHKKSENGVKIPNLIKTIVNKYLAYVVCLKMKETTMAVEDISLHKSHSPKNDSPADSMAIIIEELNVISKRLQSNDLRNTFGEEWKFAARVIDRMCMLLFGIVTLICTLILLVQRP